MKRSILIITPYIPLPANFGGALRIFNLVKHLAANNHVSLVAPGSDDDYPALVELSDICDVALVPAAATARQPAGRRKRLTQLRSLAGGRSFLELSGYIPQLQAVIDRLFMTRQIDLVQQEFPETALYTLPCQVPIVFDAHNVEHDLLARVARTSESLEKRAYNMLEARKVKRLEIAAWTRATICIATSERDAELMRGLTSTPVDVIPNGVDLELFTPCPPDQAQPAQVVFTGAMRHQPNVDGALWYVREVHPRVQQQIPHTRLAIVGADPPPALTGLAVPSVEVTGQVDDIRPYLGTAQVAVVPLWSGGGTRLKILEAFAAGRPVVSTTIGAEGLEVRDGEHLLIADTPEEFAHAVVRLCNDVALVKHLTSAARHLVETHYGWEAITQRLEKTHDQAVEIASRQHSPNDSTNRAQFDQ